MGFWKVYEPIATTSFDGVYQPTFLPFLAIYRGRFQLDPAPALRRQLLRFQTLIFRVIRGFHQGVRGVRSAHCAHTTRLDHPVKSSSDSNCLYWPLIYGY